MMLKMADHNSDPFSSLPIVTSVDDVDQKAASLGFMELLGFQDYFPHDSIFDNTTSYHYRQELMEMEKDMSVHDHHQLINEEDIIDDDINGDVNAHMKDEITTTVDEETSSVVLNGQQPSSPNYSSSICTSPAHQPLQNQLQQCPKEKKPMGGDEVKPKKKKKEKAPRFAFMTRTEIDHLDDGYRWRKYGQKAVKNSHFPRSYYRCTNASCNVKKRVERCMSDASYVITTYEGQHTHPVSLNSAPLTPSFNHIMNTAAFGATTAVTPPPPAMLRLDQGGLLQDMLHCHH